MNLEPLVGLASDQVDRATATEHNLEGYHCDEHQMEDQRLLMDRLLKFNSDGVEEKHVTINLFIGPKLLTTASWKALLERLARMGLISMLIVDEAHCISQSGQKFRQEFESAIEFLGHLLTLMPHRVPVVLLSATILKSDVTRCTDLLRTKKLCVLHGSLERRTIDFSVIVSGRAGSSLKKHARVNFKKRPNAQQIWYTHSRTKAETSLRDMADTLLEENRKDNKGPHSVAMPFVGTNGIMQKTTTMDGIKLYSTLDGEGTVLDPASYKSIAEGHCRWEGSEDVKLPKIQVIVATKSAEAGINGTCLEFGKMSGFPSNCWELVQQLGRVDRKGTADPGSNTYEIHVDFNCYVSLFLRIVSGDSADERQIQLEQLHEVLRFLLLPTMCYHMAMEMKFKWNTNANKVGCGNYCSKCRGDIAAFTKRVHKAGLQSLLTTKIHGTTEALSVTNFVKAMKKPRKSLFHKDDVPRIGSESKIHGVCLQMIAGGMIALKAKENTKVGTEKMTKENVCVVCSNTKKRQDGYTLWSP